MRRLRALSMLPLLLIVFCEGNAQVLHPPRAPRIKVWYSLPSPRGPAANMSSHDGTQANRNNIPTSSSRPGYYIEVDTTTDGTHATFTVTTTADTGVGSFTKAIKDANNNPGLDYIYFAIGSGPQTLSPDSLPSITDPVVIDATTQPDPNSTGKPMIELDGTTNQTKPGLLILAGNSIVRGLVINRCRYAAIEVIGPAGNNVVEKNFLGLNFDGTDSSSNGGSGVYILNSPNNRIGDTISTGRNVIAGSHAPNIDIEGSGSIGNIITGNYIGTDQSGLIDLSGETNGVRIFDGASNNIIGGLQSEAGNLISGCDFPDIFIGGTGTSYNVVQGNRIGSGLHGLTVMQNGNGIRISAGASDNLIGHTTIAGRNIISCSIIPYPGLVIDGAATTNNVVQGNIIGAPPSSTYDFGNSDGVFIANSPHNIIGGTSSGAANWISGNLGQGVLIGGSASTGNRIEGNLIGDPYIPGRPSLLGNLGSGVFIRDAPGNIIGGRDPLAANTISANFQHGIVIRGDTATGNAVQGNFIGGQEDGVPGTSSRGNHGNGVLLIASGDTIGGNEPNAGNIIVYNKGIGVYDSVGNGNVIRYNSISSNDSMEIDLAPRGITPNDPLDIDTGPNDLQNFPILDSASFTPGSIRIHGKLESKPSTTYTLDFFRNEKRDRTFFGGGQMWIGSATVTSDLSGTAEIDATFPVAVPDSQFITATAIDPYGNTSEFSRALCMRDTDGDGILDCWETQGDGIDWNADGIIDLDLWGKGARPDHKDIFVEVDYMVGLRPQASALELVKSAFAGVNSTLLNNPDGGSGINLHIESLDSADVLPLVPWGIDPWPAFQAARIFNFGTLAERSNLLNGSNILAAKQLVYRYCIFADRFDETATGKARVVPGNPGNDFLVSLGAWEIGRRDNPLLQAGTFMHELGHTLGLRHGGTDGLHYKPNYYSVMNYAWQYPRSLKGIDSLSWKLDYSPTQLMTLDENHLDESLGLGLLSANLLYPVVKIPYARPNGAMAQAWLRPNTAVNWDGIGDSSGFSSGQVNINNIDPSLPSPPGEQLIGYADWPNLQYNFRNTPGVFSRSSGDTLVHEITEEIYNHLLTLPPYGIVSPLISWSSDPNINIPISTAPVVQSDPVVASDGEGGAYIAWTHGSTSPSLSGVYAQRLNAFGALQWLNNGIPVAVGPENQGMQGFIGDGEGNAIVSWLQRRTGSFDIRAQKINRFGQGLWGSGGASVTTVNNDPGYPWARMKSDGQGGAIVVWNDRHSGTRSLFAQRIDASGVTQWTPGGVLISSTPLLNYESDVQIVGDGIGGAVITWTDGRNGGGVGDIYAQRVSASGLVRWTANGVPVCISSGHQGAPVLASNYGGGAIVAWVNYRAGGKDIYAQQVDSSGQTVWATNGIAVVTGTAAQFSIGLGIVTDGSHGAIISWLDGRRVNYNDSYVQRIDPAGVPRWTPNGVALTDTLGCSESIVISDNNGRAIVVFVRNVFQSNIKHVFAQTIDSAGSIGWVRNGVPIALAAGSPSSLSAASDLAGGAIIAWMSPRPDPLSGERHIYAQNVTSSGGLGGGVTTGLNQPPTSELPSRVNLEQNFPNPFNPNTTIRYTLPERSIVSLKIYNILGQEVVTLVNGIEEPGERQTHFNANNMASGVYFYRIVTTAVRTNASFTTVKKMMLIR